MKTANDYNLPPEFKNGIVLTLGNFDGVHLGHKAVILETKKIAAEMNLSAVVMTFEPHPISLLRPELEPFRITSPEQKAELITDLKIDLLLTVKFDKDFAEISAEDFVKNILVEKLKIRHIVIGHDFNFGRRRAGNAEYIKAKADEYGFGFTRVSAERNASENFSSTRIREYLRKGEIVVAEALLGHPFEIMGEVMHGNKKGRTLGFPTANLELGDYIRPKFGVYAAETQILKGGAWHKSIANIGVRPTIKAERVLLEAHIFNFSENIYGRSIKVRLKNFIRAEMKFANLEQLKKQIAADVKGLC